MIKKMNVVLILTTLLIAGCDLFKTENISPSISTTRDKLYIFNAGKFNGNLGGRTGADLKVSNSTPRGMTVSAAFISVNNTDQLKEIPAKYNFPTDIPIFALDINNLNNIVKLADNWADLMDGEIVKTLSKTGVLPESKPNDRWWSGSSSDGSASTKTCSSWTSSSESGMVGSPSAVKTSWLSMENQSGINFNYLLGIGY